MTNWTSTARTTLENYLEKNRSMAATSGGDADEVVSDLRRHVEEELASLNLSAITEQDVQRIVSRVGPVPPTNDNPSAEVPRARNWRHKLAPVGSTALFIFGILLPLGTLIFELVTHLCAGTFFDPLPTWIHVFMVVIVPVANFFAWLNLRNLSASALRWLWRANGVALGVSLFYAVLYLPMSPFAVIGILFFGFGLLPLAPLLSAICAFRFRVRLKREYTERATKPPRGWTWSAIIPALILTLFALPGPLTRHWVEVAGGESAAESTRAIKLLRLFGNEDALLKECYGRNDRIWAEIFGGRQSNPDLAQMVFYRVTGKAYNSVLPPFSKYQRGARDLFGEFDWDTGLGGEAVAAQVKGLSLSESRMDGICKPEEGWSYIEWILEFRNIHESSQREARAQIQLPPGGVVSRLTLWVNGEEREAAFAGRGEVREAYQKIAVQQRRDPVLVTTSGPDRVLMQCFPIQPKGGVMKVRIGITTPLAIESTNRTALRLPSLVERNFKIAKSFEHNLWIESSRAVSASSKKLKWDSANSGKQGILGQLSETELGSSDATLWFDSPDASTIIRAVDRKSAKPAIIQQTVEPIATKLPNRIAIVLDGSESMNPFFSKIAKSLDGIPSQPELDIYLVQDGLRTIFSSAWRGSESASATVANVKGYGGQDNVSGLMQAWEWAAAKPEGIILWIHGAQPTSLTAIEPLKQRLDWRAADGPTIIDVPVKAGPNVIAEKLATTSAKTGLPRFGALPDDLERLFGCWSKRRTEFQFIRTVDDSTEATDAASANGSSHIVRLWASQEIQRLVKARRIAEAVNLANLYELVTPVSGAVVLETKQQFAEAGLTPADPATVPSVSSVPETTGWEILVMSAIFLLMSKRYLKKSVQSSP